MTMRIQTIDPRGLYELMRTGKRIDLIDIRTSAEFRKVHAERARLAPLGALDPDALIASRAGASGEPIYVICRSGYRSLRACEAFLSAGFGNVVNVEGGTAAWEAAGLPVERETPPVSLSHQVWVAAGLLILVGTYLGRALHPSFYALSAVAGAALLITGIRDDNSLELLLARMPWNQTGRDRTGRMG